MGEHRTGTISVGAALCHDRGHSLNWTDREKTMLAMLGALAIAMLLMAAVYSRW
jgi:hypothetical protein